MNDGFQDSAHKYLSTPSHSFPRHNQTVTPLQTLRPSADMHIPSSPNPNIYSLLKKSNPYGNQLTPLQQSNHHRGMQDGTPKQVGNIQLNHYHPPRSASEMRPENVFSFPDPQSSSSLPTTTSTTTTTTTTTTSSSTALHPPAISRHPSVDSGLLSPGNPLQNHFTSSQLNRNQMKLTSEPLTPSSSILQHLSGSSNQGSSSGLPKITPSQQLQQQVSSRPHHHQQHGSSSSSSSGDVLTTPLHPTHRVTGSNATNFPITPMGFTANHQNDHLSSTGQNNSITLLSTPSNHKPLTIDHSNLLISPGIQYVSQLQQLTAKQNHGGGNQASSSGMFNNNHQHTLQNNRSGSGMGASQTTYLSTPSRLLSTPTSRGTYMMKFSFPNVNTLGSNDTLKTQQQPNMASSSSLSSSGTTPATTSAAVIGSTTTGNGTILAAVESTQTIPPAGYTTPQGTMIRTPQISAFDSIPSDFSNMQIDPNNAYTTTQPQYFPRTTYHRARIPQELAEQRTQYEPGKQIQYPYRVLDITKQYRQVYGHDDGSYHHHVHEQSSNDSEYTSLDDYYAHKRTRRVPYNHTDGNVMLGQSMVPLRCTDALGQPMLAIRPSLHIPQSDSREQHVIDPVETVQSDDLAQHQQRHYHQSQQQQQQQLQSHHPHSMGYMQHLRQAHQRAPSATHASSQPAHRPINNLHRPSGKGQNGGLNGPAAANSHRRRRRRQLPNQLPNRNKFCAACKTKSSVYFREIRVMPGHKIVFCNGCCLRYKKVSLACIKCLYVPYKSDEGLGNQCRLCGEKLVCLESEEFQRRLTDDPLNASDIGLILEPSQASDDASMGDQQRRAPRVLRPSQQQIQQQRERGSFPSDDLPNVSNPPSSRSYPPTDDESQHKHQYHGHSQLPTMLSSVPYVKLPDHLSLQSDTSNINGLSPSLQPRSDQLFIGGTQSNDSLFFSSSTSRSRSLQEDGDDMSDEKNDYTDDVDEDDEDMISGSGDIDDDEHEIIEIEADDDDVFSTKNHSSKPLLSPIERGVHDTLGAIVNKMGKIAEEDAKEDDEI